MSEYKQVQRQVQIMVFLSAMNKGMTVAEIHQRLGSYGSEATLRTIRRDMEDLCGVFPIYTSGSDKEPVYHLNGVSMDRVEFGLWDMQAFLTLRELSKPYGHLDIGIRMSRFLEMLEESLPSKARQWLLDATESLTVKAGDLPDEKDIDPDIRRTIEECIRSKRCMNMRYTAFYSNATSNRIVEPMQIELTGGCYHLHAYCREKREMRDFRMSRIDYAKETDDVFILRKDLLAAHLKNRFNGMSSAKVDRIVLKFTGFTARLVKEYHHAKSDHLTLHLDGSLLFERTTGVTPELVQWILQFGSGVEVLEPKELRTRVRKELYLAMGRYQEE